MGQKMVRFGELRGTRSRQDASIEVHEAGRIRPSSGSNGGHVLSLYPLIWRSLPLARIPRHWRLLHLFRRRPTVLPRAPPRQTSSGGPAHQLRRTASDYTRITLGLRLFGPGSVSFSTSKRVTCAPSTDFGAKCSNCKAAVWSAYWIGIARPDAREHVHGAHQSRHVVAIQTTAHQKSHRVRCFFVSRRGRGNENTQ
jgi:hypothetical protein